MKLKHILISTTAACCLMAFSQINLTGKWVGHLIRPHSTDSATFIYNLQQTNNTLTGAITGPDGVNVDIDSGKVAGNNFSFGITEGGGWVKITGTYYPDSLSSNVMLPNGRLLHLKMLRSK